MSKYKEDIRNRYDVRVKKLEIPCVNCGVEPRPQDNIWGVEIRNILTGEKVGLCEYCLSLLLLKINDEKRRSGEE